MKDSEFLELLNLYLDHEITAADSARLEAAVLSDPKRREIYRDYCRMQKACRILAAEVAAETTGAKIPQLADNVIPFEGATANHSGRWVRYAGLAGGLAAACVALVFVGRWSRQASLNAPTVAVGQPAQTGNSGGSAKAALLPAGGNAGIHGLVSLPRNSERESRTNGSLVASSLVLSNGAQSAAAVSAAVKEADDQLAWVRNLQIVSLRERNPIEQLRFAPAPATMQPEGRPLGGRAPLDATVEMTAFRFQR